MAVHFGALIAYLALQLRTVVLSSGFYLLVEL